MSARFAVAVVLLGLLLVPRADGRRLLADVRGAGSADAHDGHATVVPSDAAGVAGFQAELAGLAGAGLSYATPSQNVDVAQHLVRRRLQQSRLGVGNRGANNIRAQAATAQAIAEAVQRGATIFDTARAGRVGSTLSFAAAQNDQQLFDTVERLTRP